MKRETDLEENEKNAGEEADGASEFLLAREEEDRLGGTDDEGEAGEEENLGEARKGEMLACTRPGKARERRPTLPRARRAPSKNIMQPRSMKKTPNEVRPTPISAGGEGQR